MSYKGGDLVFADDNKIYRYLAIMHAIMGDGNVTVLKAGHEFTRASDVQIANAKANAIAPFTEMADVEIAESNNGYYFNCATTANVAQLQSELRNDNVDCTVLCWVNEFDPTNVYYTPKSARMLPGGRWTKRFESTK